MPNHAAAVSHTNRGNVLWFAVLSSVQCNFVNSGPWAVGAGAACETYLLHVEL